MARVGWGAGVAALDPWPAQPASPTSASSRPAATAERVTGLELGCALSGACRTVISSFGECRLVPDPERVPFPGPCFLASAVRPMIREMREKLSREVDALSHELNILLPQAIAQAVALGDLRENSEYKAALERQQFVQARLGQLHQRLNQLTQLADTQAPADRVGLGSRVTVLDLETNEIDIYTVVLAEMMDIDAGHISLASPLGRALKDGRVGDEIGLRLPTANRKLRITELVTIHQIGESVNGRR
ncbi:MAG TPA: GreA/GreB family elongation factor [Gemmatimonadales bacterium]|nr:GreA/GreB family elongation factor [Gemmatimonadales bacterium]